MRAQMLWDSDILIFIVGRGRRLRSLTKLDQALEAGSILMDAPVTIIEAMHETNIRSGLAAGLKLPRNFCERRFPERFEYVDLRQ
jgi:hypothetical protein